MKRPLCSAIPILLGALLWQAGAHAQTEAASKTLELKEFSLGELERFLGGRTLVTVDLKDATLAQVGAALSESTGLKVAPRVMGMPSRIGIPPRISSQPRTILQAGTIQPGANLQPSEPTFTLAATKQPFWEALRDWSLASRHSAEEAKKAALLKADPTNPDISVDAVPTSVEVQRGLGGLDGWEISPGDSLAEGRAVSSWPFLILGSDLRRTQDGQLNDSGLEELAPLLAPGLPVAPAGPVPNEKRWNDRLLLTAFVVPDPKLIPRDMSIRVDEAIDEKGNDLRAPAGETKRFSGTHSMNVGSPYFVVLASRPDMGQRLVKLRGTPGCNVVTRTHHWETTDLTTPVDDILGGEGGDFKIQYKGMVPNGRTWKLTFEAQSRGSHLEGFWKSQVGMVPVSGSFFGGIFNFAGTPSLQLFDAQDRRFLPGFGSRSNRLGRGIADAAAASPADFSTTPADIAQNWNYSETFNFEFDPPFVMQGSPAAGLPKKLSFNFPIERRHVSVPFEFTDLPLPPSQWTSLP